MLEMLTVDGLEEEEECATFRIIIILKVAHSSSLI